MSLWMTALFLLTSVLWNLTSAGTDEAVDCCLTTSDQRLSVRAVKSYSVQTTHGGCRIPATVLTTWKNRRLCAPPAFKGNWVGKLIKALKKRGRGHGEKRRPKNRGRHN
ncbi:C-C motif chemokine 19b [Polymixia lowei]